MNMIEKVARALAMSQNPGNWEADFTEEDRQIWRIRAKAAIEAMREPTEGMVKPVINADGFFKLSDPVRAWELMIDAALKEE